MEHLRSGFRPKAVHELPELNGRLHEMEHEKSGARLVWLERAEENKTFGIAFQTQPCDDTGVFHILEHSVLCGSEKYPVKEPFVELMKSSLNTYLNAMTFPDKTFYPVSSRNFQDFINLLRVYMDAVLHPLIHRRPEIFAQEGWHYELAENGEAFYKGVVFNEMKGAFASPDMLLRNEMNRRLFPDTCYRHVSGGDPAHIPELTWERFAEAHRRLYHPSNAYIFLDGHMDIGQTLSILDEEYLAAYDRAPVPPEIPVQKPVDSGRAEILYELSPQEALPGRERLAFGYVACTFRDREEIAALQALADLLCGDNQAPLNRRMLKDGLAKDVHMSLQDGVRQPWALLEIRDVAEGKTEEAAAALRGELERLAEEGLDHQRISAALDNLEFQMRQRDYGRMPQGLVLGLQILESWLYGGEPAANLSVGGLFDSLRQKCGEGYFEALLRRVLLENPHACQVLMRPSHTVGQERQAREAARLRAAREGWSAAELEDIRRRQEDLRRWQNAPDAPEALASIPMLRLDQIPAEPEKLPHEEASANGLPVLRHALDTGGITYLNLYFALDDLTAEQLVKTAFLCQLLGSLDTAAHDMDALQKAQRSLLGSLQFSVDAFGGWGQPQSCQTFLCVSASMLDGKAEKAVSLLTEIAIHTRLDAPDKIRALLGQRRAALAEQIVMAGHSAAMGRVAACCTAEGAVREYIGGVSFCRWLKELEEGFEEKIPALQEELAGLAAKIFCRRRLTVSVAASDGGMEDVVAGVLADRLPEGAYSQPDASLVKPWPSRKEGIVIPADVSFAAVGGLLPQARNGAAKVMARAVSLGYLWNAVRVQGGAYGAGMLADGTGMAACYSYRDPGAAGTLDCCRKIPDFLEKLDGLDMTAIILGATAESEPLLTPRMKAKTADAWRWRGIAYPDLCRVRREMLAATPEKLAALAQPVREMMEAGAVCVLGSRRQLDACAGRLDTIEAL